MKTLHYSIIVILVIGISFFIGENAYGCLGNCPPIIPPTHYASPPITVQTNLENYSTGDNIVITGQVFNKTKDTPLMIKIFDPIRQLQFDKNVPVSLNGNYTWTLSTVDFWSFNASGNYTILAQYGHVYAITHFNLNSALTQYLYSQSPLWQFRNGMSAQDVHCHAGLTLIVRKENFTPACTHPITATHLILSGWALGTPPIKSFISSIDINGLQQNYTVGQPIDATISYTGYWNRADIPDVKIFDANNTQIWFNCPNCVPNNVILGITGNIASTTSYGNFTYHVQDYNGHLPVINETGIYTMVISLDNKKTSAKFTVVNPSCGEMTMTIPNFGNMTYPVLLMNTNSTSCVKSTYTVVAHYYDNETKGGGMLGSTRTENFSIQIGDLHYETLGDGFGVSSGKDFTNSFKITVLPETVDLANYPVGSNFTVTYIIRPLPNATGFYDQSIEMPPCLRYPLAVGYAADQVNSSDFSKGLVTMMNHSCVVGQVQLRAVEASGINYMAMKLP